MIHINLRQATHPHAPTAEGRPPLPPPTPWSPRWSSPQDHQAWHWMAGMQLEMLVAVLADDKRMAT